MNFNPNQNKPWRNQPQGQPQSPVIQQQIDLRDLSEDDYVYCPECDRSVFIQAFKIIIPKLAIVGERQAIAIPGWQCTECGHFQMPNEVKALREIEAEEKAKHFSKLPDKPIPLPTEDQGDVPA